MAVGMQANLVSASGVGVTEREAYLEPCRASDLRRLAIQKCFRQSRQREITWSCCSYHLCCLYQLNPVWHVRLVLLLAYEILPRLHPAEIE